MEEPKDEIYLGKPEELFKALEKEIKGPRLTVVQIAPAVRVSLGEEFGMKPGEDATGKIIALLKKLGFDHVIDTPLGADINIYEEALDILDALEKGNTEKFPIFNSCCIGWRLYCKNKHPELYSLVSEIASPHMVTGSAAKHFISKKLKIPIEDIAVISVMPCTLKKYEVRERLPSGIRYCDYVLTTQELAQWAKKRKLDLKKMKDEPLSPLLPGSSKGGVIFGATGGIIEALLSTLAYEIGQDPKLIRFRGDQDVKHICLQLGPHRLNIASIYGIRNLDKILEKIRSGEVYHFVEVMNCPYGCVGGPGQPIPATEEKYIARAHGLRSAADKKERKVPQQNPTVRKIYSLLRFRPHSKKAKELFYFHETRI